MASQLHFIVTILILCNFLIVTVPVVESTDDRPALVAIRNHITTSPGSTNIALINNWTQETSFCNWQGVTCSPTRSRVTSLSLSGIGLGGTIPREIGNLSFLVSLDIANNSLQGNIPEEIGNLRRLANLSLENNQLEGRIPPGFGTLTQLQVLDLSHNRLSGTIPASVFNISSLVTLDLTNNTVSGGVPRDICDGLPMMQGLFLSQNQLGELLPSLHKCTRARYIYLSSNNFTGTIPQEIGNLTTLQELFLGYNSLTGTLPEDIGEAISLRILDLEEILVGAIPASLGNLTNLEMLYLGGNNFQGNNIPPELGHLTNLKELFINFANLSGEIPASIFNISTLSILALTNNSLTGNLPIDIDLQMPNLQYLLLSFNKLTGSVPMSISNATELIMIDLCSNILTGQVPLSLGNLPHLEGVNLENNRLSNAPDKVELEFLNSLNKCPELKNIQLCGNPFNGVLPRTIGNLSSTLQNLRLGGCGLKGEIPSGIGNLSGLIWLEMSENELTGQLPSSVGNMRNLQSLSIHGNRLQGTIPRTFCDSQNLYKLNLGSNKLSGEFLSCLGNVSSLRELYMDSNELTTSVTLLSFWNNKDLSIIDLSNNFLSGALSQEIGSIRGLRELYLSGNSFHGEIPVCIVGLQDLVALSLSTNQLSGPIPERFGDLVSLNDLDLSHNNISGTIPLSLVNVTHLSYLNLSFNDLSGEIPDGGPFQNFSAESFIENHGLCGSPRFHVMACRRSSVNTRMSRRTRVLLEYLLPLSAALVLLVIGFMILIGKYRKKDKHVDVEKDLELAQRITYHEILSATDKFDDANIIGRGSSSSVYKGLFPNGMTAAVKRFNLDLKEIMKSFDKECEFMRNTRHRNLVKVIGSCSNLDLKAIIMEFMAKGSLESCFYSQNYCLDMAARLGILIDVASALTYLHHSCSIPIVHCDVKPNNILFDDGMVAHLGDFGISKLLGDNRPMVQTKTLGTVGYMAPEYGSEGKVSTMVDVYSFGILIMEIVTRKKPTDDRFDGEFTMKKWVSESLVQDKIMEILDYDLLVKIEEDNLEAHRTCLAALLKLAMECTEHAPKNRTGMDMVLVRLNKMRAEFLLDPKLYTT